MARTTSENNNILIQIISRGLLRRQLLCILLTLCHAARIGMRTTATTGKSTGKPVHHQRFEGNVLLDSV